MPLCVADGIVVYQFGVFQIFGFERLLPQLHRQHVGVNDSARLCPRIETVKPVVVLVVLSHPLGHIQAEARFGLLHIPALASEGCIAEQSAASGERSVCLGFDTREIHLQEAVNERLYRLSQLLVTQHCVGMNKAFHADEHAPHVGRECPTVARSHYGARLCSLALHAVFGSDGIGSELVGQGQEEVAGYAAYHLAHAIVLLPPVILAQSAQHPAIARELLLVRYAGMYGAHVALGVEVCRHQAYDFVEILGCAVRSLRIQRECQYGASLGVTGPVERLLLGEEHVLRLVLLLLQPEHIALHAR